MDQAGSFSEATRGILLEYGWHPGRSVDIAGWEAELVTDGFPPLHQAARQFLIEYGGLRFLDGGSGVTRAREPFRLVPTACSGEADRFIDWGEHINRDISPIGELAAGTCAWAYLGMDERGEVYVVIDRLASFGRLPLALDRLVLGHMPREVE
ncbi:SUKH-3 domain-containing protein [Catellatospora citrea]|uniref:SUKH-3 immunity protein of toxin-antitoxin system n=1 Tax=Catellatospora citrea TaxID=53366 RepID=A0A8J3P3M7_9ACTN|nr:SUKH-3 domain-containing protein [Catellatospora citrea]RKE11916.1 SUKH-3 immunity protein of toxin-antitoxin system [Catellatospora citrea]GIG00251.1 hypothetical protein Cci01nite_53440 [Catellatospora citrea]